MSSKDGQMPASAVPRQWMRRNSAGSHTRPPAVVSTGLSPVCTLDVGFLFHFAVLPAETRIVLLSGFHIDSMEDSFIPPREKLLSW